MKSETVGPTFSSLQSRRSQPAASACVQLHNFSRATIASMQLCRTRAPISFKNEPFTGDGMIAGENRNGRDRYKCWATTDTDIRYLSIFEARVELVKRAVSYYAI